MIASILYTIIFRHRTCLHDLADISVALVLRVRLTTARRSQELDAAEAPEDAVHHVRDAVASQPQCRQVVQSLERQPLERPQPVTTQLPATTHTPPVRYPTTTLTPVGRWSHSEVGGPHTDKLLVRSGIFS